MPNEPHAIDDSPFSTSVLKSRLMALKDADLHAKTADQVMLNQLFWVVHVSIEVHVTSS
jgi:hypothetical protein